MNDNNSNVQPKPTPEPSQDAPVFTLDSLLLGHREAVIVHGTERYRLRITAKGRLILTK